MKKTSYHLLVLLAAAAFGYGCESYLDKSPDMGMTEQDIYKDYNSIQNFLDQTYRNLENIFDYESHNNGRSHPGTICDELATVYNSANVKNINSGNWLIKAGNIYEIGVRDKTMISMSYKSIRIANRVIHNIGKVPNLTSEQSDRILGQAYFMRAWFYFQLLKRYGGMPILDKVLIGTGDEDIPRVSYHESHDWMMGDLEKAVAMLPDRWDENNLGRATKVAAMAVRSMARLYDASPLMQNGLRSVSVCGYDTSRAAQAARSAMEVLDYLEDHPELGYRLMSAEEYPSIFYWSAPPYTQPEFLWFNRKTATSISRYMRSFWLPSQYAKGTGNDAVMFQAPTQNIVDMFEKKGADGRYYPISDPRSGYRLDDSPFRGRDPRFYNNILVPGQKWCVNKQNKAQYITTYAGGDIAELLLTSRYTNQRQQTGYMCRKFLWEGADQWKEEYSKYRVVTVYIRIAQIYLDLAEASFEATGSATAKVEGCMLSALDALNVVRNRAGIGDLPDDIAADPARFREAYRRERAVELMFENHRWWDVRRWMIMHELFAGPAPLKGLRATPVDPNHKKVTNKSTLKFNYEIFDLTAEVRAYAMRNYWYPFPLDDANSLGNLVQNPGW